PDPREFGRPTAPPDAGAGQGVYEPSDPARRRRARESPPDPTDLPLRRHGVSPDRRRVVRVRPGDRPGAVPAHSGAPGRWECPVAVRPGPHDESRTARQSSGQNRVDRTAGLLCPGRGSSRTLYVVYVAMTNL